MTSKTRKGFRRSLVDIAHNQHRQHAASVSNRYIIGIAKALRHGKHMDLKRAAFLSCLENSGLPTHVPIRMSRKSVGWRTDLEETLSEHDILKPKMESLIA